MGYYKYFLVLKFKDFLSRILFYRLFAKLGSMRLKVKNILGSLLKENWDD